MVLAQDFDVETTGTEEPAMRVRDPMTDISRATRATPQPAHPAYDARKLTDDDGTALLLLDDKAYTLRITRAGKLILTK